MSHVETPTRFPCGGKAAALFELQAAGFCVPEFELAPIDSDELARAVQRLGLPLAVRSSASVEDGALSSFAGQFQTFLNVASLTEVISAADACRRSVQSPSVLDYCEQHGVDPQSVHMSVILQRMIQPDLAGVAFTVNPTTGSEEIVVEACVGQADRLLAGSSSALPPDHPFVVRHLPQITETARRIQRFFGAPQDIEFAIQGATLYILQSRPITRLEFHADIGEWTNANFRDGGVSSSVCTPLMWSLYDFIWEPTLKSCLREIRLYNGDFLAGRLFFGRPYWNLGAVKRCVAQIPGYVEREFDEDLNVRTNYDGPGERTPFTVRSILRAIPTAVCLPRFIRRQQRAAEHLLQEFKSIESRWEATVEDVEPTFRDLIERDYHRTETTYFRTVYAVSLAKLDFKRSFPGCDYSTLVAALPDLQHLAPLKTMREMVASGQLDADQLIAQFRHQCRWGMDIRHPRWDEDREFVQTLLKELPVTACRKPRLAYEQTRAATAAALPWWRRRAFHRKLDRLRSLVWLREELRDLSSRMYYLIRRHVLELARRRGLGEAIFFQTFREIYTDDRSAIEARRDAYESCRNFVPPHEIKPPHGVEAKQSYRQRAPGQAGDLVGIGASGGQVVGIAHVARNVEEALSADVGAILVCHFTEPGWATVLDRVGGVVTEHGGRLSHAAVICREFGIPAVLGVDDATVRIPHGSRIEVDGSRGRIRIHSSPQ